MFDFSPCIPVQWRLGAYFKTMKACYLFYRKVSMWCQGAGGAAAGGGGVLEQEAALRHRRAGQLAGGPQ